MGYATARGMAECVDGGQISLDQALRWHLTHNHFPPIPESMVPVAKRAIAACNAGEPERILRLPANARHRRLGKLVPAWVVVGGLHLDAFIDQVE